jgi:ribosome maturation factor RimP
LIQEETSVKGSKPGFGRTAPRQPARAPRSVAPSRPAPQRPAERAAERAAVRPPIVSGRDPQATIVATVEGLGYELVEVERAGRGLLRVTIDRRPGQAYAEPGEAVTVGDCEKVTRQLQYALEVEGADYARLEVSSPGLDRPLRKESDYARFAGAQVRVTLREPLGGRKHFEGLLVQADAGWQLQFHDGKAEQVLGFVLAEVREARLVPVLDFKGRRNRAADAAPADHEVSE